MKKTLFIPLFVLLAAQLSAQTFIGKGKIEFERKENVHKLFESDDNFSAEIKKNIPQYKITYFDLFFDGDQSLYKPGREVGENKPMFFSDGPAQDNVVHNNYTAGVTNSQKQVFETQYLIQDSLRKISWKLTTDTRKIAGFLCRKATGIVNDSVFIFAFYTDEITQPGGPEGFNGLPGMILGIAIPRIHTTWFATKVELYNVTPKDLTVPTKGRKTNYSQLQQTLAKSLSDWGKWAERNIWLVML